MSALSFADTVFALRFLRLLTMPYEKTAAYKTGAIDIDGKTLIPVADMTQEQKESYTIFHRLVFNIRRLLQKIPIVGKSILTNYATAFLMLKEETGISDELIQSILDQATRFSAESIDEESSSKIELIDNFRYHLRDSMLHPKTGELIFRENTEVLVTGKSEKTLLGIQFYEAIHLPTRQPLVICEGDVVVTPTNTVELIPPRETKDQLFPPRKKKKKSQK